LADDLGPQRAKASLGAGDLVALFSLLDVLGAQLPPDGLEQPPEGNYRTAGKP
jgi:hypothetical protein